MTDGWLSLKIQLNLLSFLWKGPPIFRGFHCLWLLLDSFFLPLTFLPHKILSPNLHLFYKNLQKLASKSCKFVKKNSVAAVVLLKTKRSIPICSPWVPFDLGSLYCLFRRTFAHFTKMCIKKQGKASAERREREESLISCLLCWYQYATLEISNFSPGGHHQVGLSIREKAPYYLCFSGHINFKKKKS